MNIFIIHKSIAKQYMAFQNKIRYNKKLMEYSKAWAVIVIFLFFLGVYVYYINKASTLGYTFRQEQKKRDAAEFTYNIQAFQTTKAYQALRNSALQWPKYMGTDSKWFSLRDIVYTIK
jgi:hypothetical protein